MTSFVLGVDSGGTSTKVVLYDQDGRVISRVTRATPHSVGESGRMERDPEEHWLVVAAAIGQVIADSRVDARHIIGVGIAAQGDGLLLVDGEGQAVGPALLSSDTRAAALVATWALEGRIDEIVQLTGQSPFPGSQGALLAWVADNEPGVLGRAKAVLAPKDWLRLRMTGGIATDRTDAGASFADARTQQYSQAALSAYGVQDYAPLLPEIREPTDVVGSVTPAAAAVTGLAAGTPVVAGMHDVIATIIGSVGMSTGRLCVVAGTFGVNVVLSDHPMTSVSINSRSGPRAGIWAPRRTSRASAVNVEWASQIVGAGSGGMPVPALDDALQRTSDLDDPLYLPYLNGGNGGQPQSASFLGLRGWHTSTHLLRSVVEGVTFTHRLDIERLIDEIPVASVHVSGGAGRNPSWVQLFADALGRAVTAAPTVDAGALGAAIAAAVGVGVYADFEAATRVMVPAPDLFHPSRTATVLEERYQLFCKAVDTIAELDGARPSARLLAP